MVGILHLLRMPDKHNPRRCTQRLHRIPNRFLLPGIENRLRSRHPRHIPVVCTRRLLLLWFRNLPGPRKFRHKHMADILRRERSRDMHNWPCFRHSRPFLLLRNETSTGNQHRFHIRCRPRTHPRPRRPFRYILPWSRFHTAGILLRGRIPGNRKSTWRTSCLLGNPDPFHTARHSPQRVPTPQPS